MDALGISAESRCGAGFPGRGKKHGLSDGSALIRRAAFVLAVLMAAASAHAASTDETGLFTVKFRGDEVAITGCNYEYAPGAPVELVVPAYVEGLPVTTISDRALSSFENYDLDHIERIRLPGTVVRVGERAFAGLEGITEIVLPDSVRELGDYAFKYCPALTSVRLSASLVSIPEGCFDDCSSLSAVVIPEDSVLESVMESAFDDCYALTGIELPGTLRYIDDYAFAWTSLEEVNIPPSVRVIGSRAFHVTELSSVTIPRPTRIAGDSFDDDVTLLVFRGSQAASVASDSDMGYRYLPAGGALDVPEYDDSEYDAYESPYGSYDDDDDDFWYYDDDSYDDDEDVPPVTVGQLEDLVAHILDVEASGTLSGGSVGTTLDDGSVFMRTGDMLLLVNAEWEFPYMYYRIDSYVPGIPDFIYVLYGRPTGSNAFYYGYSAYLIEDEDAEDFLSNDDLEERWERINGYTIPYRTTVTIDGRQYEVLCTDIDDDQDDDDGYDYDDDVSLLDRPDDFLGWDSDEFVSEVSAESLSRLVRSIAASLEQGDFAEGALYRTRRGTSLLIDPWGAELPYVCYVVRGGDGQNMMLVGYAQGTSYNRAMMSQMAARFEDDAEQEGLFPDAGDDIYALCSIGGILYDVYLEELL